MASDPPFVTISYRMRMSRLLYTMVRDHYCSANFFHHFPPSISLASSCDQGDVVSFLLSNGADPTIKDCDELTPVQVAGEPSTKQLFQSYTNSN